MALDAEHFLCDTCTFISYATVLSIYVYIYIYVCNRMYVCVCVCIYIYTCILAYMEMAPTLTLSLYILQHDVLKKGPVGIWFRWCQRTWRWCSSSLCGVGGERLVHCGRGRGMTRELCLAILQWIGVKKDMETWVSTPNMEVSCRFCIHPILGLLPHVKRLFILLETGWSFLTSFKPNSDRR